MEEIHGETEILKGLEGGENMAVRFVDNLLGPGAPGKGQRHPSGAGRGADDCTDAHRRAA
ncbi:MAG: hypothetical protein ACLUD2_20855 [Clostridium sp.]